MNIDINVVPEEDTVIPMELDMDVVNYTGVQSVNGMSGDVVLTASDVGALPQDYTPPVTSVNRKTGDVVLRYSDVGALPDTTVIPTKTSQLRNDSGFITSVPVQTVNGKTGNVVLDASDVGAIPETLLDILLIKDSTTGNPANVPDSAGFPVIDLSANIVPIQSGTGDPSPSNMRPISGSDSVTVLRTGKNLLHIPTETVTLLSGVVVSASEGKLQITGTGSSYGTYNIDLPYVIPAGTQLVLNGNSTGSGTVSYRIRNIDGGNYENISLNIAKTVSFDVNRIQVAVNPNIEYSYTIENVQLEIGSTATSYEPYTSVPYTKSLGRTVYGGTIDYTTGVLTVDMAIVNLGDLTWRYNQANLSGFDTADIASLVAGGNNAICSIYPLLNMPMTSANVTANDVFFRINKKENGTTETGNFVLGALFIKDTQYSDVTAFKTAMNGQYLCYDLAEPQTYQLTPTQVDTLFGTNNFISNGTVSVTYYADTKLYIDKKTQ